MANAYLGPPTKKGFGGLRRLGTVLVRDKGPKEINRPASPEKRSRTGRNPLRRGQSSRQNMQQIDSPPQTPSGPLPSQPPQLAIPSIQRDTNRSTNRSPSSNRAQQDKIEPQRNGFSALDRGSSLAITNGIQTNSDIPPVPKPQTAASLPQPTQTQRNPEENHISSNAVDDITRAQQEAAALG